MKVLAEFLASAASEAQFPVSAVPEVAFLGRSNVGKSSLLNSLVQKKIAHVSSTPGRTRTINFFSARWRLKQNEPDLLLVDLPGYGYARVSREISATWARFVDPYLEQREALALCIVLIDSNIPAQPADRALLDFLRSVNRDFVVVGTKADRLSGNKLRGALQGLASAHGVEIVLPYSARTGDGREQLWLAIRKALERSHFQQ